MERDFPQKKVNLKERVLDNRSDPTHPLVRGRTKVEIPTALDLFDPVSEPVSFRSMSSMEAGGE